jgi:hydrogenase maturation protease
VPNVVILGYGNPLRGDDAVGWLAATELRSRLTDCDVRVVATHQLNPEHAELLAEADLAVFIDASAETPAGTLTQTQIYPAQDGARPYTHHLTPETLLACAREFYGASPEAVLFAVGGRNFSYGKMSQAVVELFPFLLEEVALVCRG